MVVIGRPFPTSLVVAGFRNDALLAARFLERIQRGSSTHKKDKRDKEDRSTGPTGISEIPLPAIVSSNSLSG